MVTGGAPRAYTYGEAGSTDPIEKFPYRSSSVLTDFFTDCDTEYQHPGTSRVPWTQEVLGELNEGPTSIPQLPPDGIVRVIEELMDPRHFRGRSIEGRNECLDHLNEVLGREGLEAYLDGAGLCHVRAGQTSSASLNVEKRFWSQKDLEHKKKWEAYLGNALEDEFTEKVLVPLLQQCGFRRISVTGHKDKALEFGKDIWMKYQLPTSHFIYFGVQVKSEKIDAAGKSKGDHENIAEVLNQAKMALAHPVWDPEVNKRILIDHIYIVSSGEITKQARQFLGEKLDMDSRRQLIFMDREDILVLVVQTSMRLPTEQPPEEASF
jgi:hypothetical protein